ncbi:MAG TPA: CBS domain-containing protein [Saprospiraceae bacterium]|nr:CBS domain-containing protein [Saprospiraceae bacterium]HPI05052.1 CBS domain-containing protein [Saprospiraceae bacterium]
MMNERLQSLMTSNVITLTPEDTLGQARALFLEKRIHHLPIIEGKILVGMVTSWDIFKLGKSAEEYNDIRIYDVMTRKLATLEPDSHLGAAAEVLMQHLFHAIPIVNDQHELVGIVTTYDLLKYEFGKEYPDNLDKFVPENML